MRGRGGDPTAELLMVPHRLPASGHTASIQVPFARLASSKLELAVPEVHLSNPCPIRNSDRASRSGTRFCGAIYRTIQRSGKTGGKRDRPRRCDWMPALSRLDRPRGQSERKALLPVRMRHRERIQLAKDVLLAPANFLLRFSRVDEVPRRQQRQA